MACVVRPSVAKQCTVYKYQRTEVTVTWPTIPKNASRRQCKDQLTGHADAVSFFIQKKLLIFSLNLTLIEYANKETSKRRHFNNSLF